MWPIVTIDRSVKIIFFWLVPKAFISNTLTTFKLKNNFWQLHGNYWYHLVTPLITAIWIDLDSDCIRVISWNILSARKWYNNANAISWCFENAFFPVAVSNVRVSISRFANKKPSDSIKIAIPHIFHAWQRMGTGNVNFRMHSRSPEFFSARFIQWNGKSLFRNSIFISYKFTF